MLGQLSRMYSQLCLLKCPKLSMEESTIHQLVLISYKQNIVSHRDRWGVKSYCSGCQGIVNSLRN